MTIGPDASAPPRPPRMAEWLLERLLPGDATAAIGDLAEEFAVHAAASSEEIATRWYWRQAGSLATAYLQDRRVRRREAAGKRLPRVDRMQQDIRDSFRALGRSPSFTLVAVALLALGIGATSAIFSFVDGVLLRPLPYRDPNNIIAVWERPPGQTRNVISALNFLDWQSQNVVFDAMAASSNAASTLSRPSGPVQVPGARVSASYFDIFGATPAVGRMFAPGEDTPGREHVVVLSYGLWDQQFGADPSIVGRSVTLDGVPYTVIGVLPANSPFNRGWAQLWRPLAFRAGERTRDYHWLRVTAHLKPGVTLEQARANMDAIGARIAHDYPHSNKDWGVHLDRLPDILVGSDLRQSLQLLLGAVGLLLLLGCANLANLSLARATNREREVVVRAALGASRARILRQFLTESVILSLTGGAIGVGVGYLLMRGLRALLPPLYLPREALVTLDWRAVLFCGAVAILTGLLFGVAPAVHASRVDLSSSMRSSARSVTGDRGRRRLRHSLVVAEMAIACVLLAAAGLLSRSFLAMRGIDAARDPSHLLTANLFAPDNRFANADEARVFYRRVYERAAALPGVRMAAIASTVPLQGWSDGMPLTVAETRREGGGGFKEVTPSYFATIGLSILRGRGLTENDRQGSSPVIVVNQQFADQFFPGDNPIGKHLLIQEIIPGQRALGPDIPWEIVGVVENEHAGGLGDHDGAGMYVSIEQSPTYGPNIVLRTATDADAMTEPLRTAIKHVDPDQVVAGVQTMQEMERQYVAPERLRTSLVSAFGAIALLLAAIGIYGVMSYSVEQRTAEIGIRAALGASAGSLVGLVMRQATVITLVGTVIGVAASVAAGSLLASLLFGITPRDPVALIAAPAALGVTALVAAWVPARRAASIDPIRALRTE